MANTHKFTGKELDSETGLGLYYFGARYYDPGIGRFITPDPSGPDFNDPQTLNPYVYCTNNSLKYIDPDGKRQMTKNEYDAIMTAVRSADIAWYKHTIEYYNSFGSELTAPSLKKSIAIKGVPEAGKSGSGLNWKGVLTFLKTGEASDILNWILTSEDPKLTVWLKSSGMTINKVITEQLADGTWRIRYIGSQGTIIYRYMSSEEYEKMMEELRESENKEKIEREKEVE